MPCTAKQQSFPNPCVAINPAVSVEKVGPSAVMLYNEEEYVVLEGVDAARILVHLGDGACRTEEIVRRLEETIPADRVRTILEQLEQRGWIVEHDAETPQEEAAFWALMNLDSRLVSRRTQEVRVQIKTFGHLDEAPLRSALRLLNIPVNHDG